MEVPEVHRLGGRAEVTMAFAMSLPRTKRVKYIEPDGKEVFQEEDRWALVHAVHNTEVGTNLVTQSNFHFH